MTEQKIPLLKRINDSSAQQLASLPEVADRFKYIYTIMHGKKSGEQFYEAEKFHFMKTLQDNPNLQDCTKLSLYGCFMDVAVSGLSFDTSMKHLYVVPFNNKVSKKGEPDRWEKRATLMISGYGELSIRIRQGQIKYADNPVLVYEGDKFSQGIRNGETYVEHEALFPRKTDNIIACYIRITRNDDSVDFKVMSIEEIMKLKKFSKDPNSKAWVEGLPGMVQAKTIKHAFRSYPKIRKGDFSQLASEVIDQEAELVGHIDYGLETPAAVNTASATALPQSNGNGNGNSKPAVDDESFVTNEEQPGETVTIKDDDF